ncbi:MAG: Fic family protein [Deltaproteobacteria bacterium]|jgi:Fic family protein|nr:Fic family protein [Deltaproteobacteria bacterium]
MAKYPHLTKHQIPSEIKYSDRLVNLLMRIAQTKPYIEEYLGKPLEVQLLRQAKILAITYSNQIEGNRLEERGVTEALEGSKSKTSDRDIIEVRNYSDALEYVETLAGDKRKLKIRDMCDIQKLVTKDLLEEKKQWGDIRTIKVGIVDAHSGKKIDDVPEPHFLKELLGDLWNWLDDHQDIDPFVRSFAFHYLAVAIHPFADGNGRTMRLMQHLLLLKRGEEIARFVPSETAIMATRGRYYSSIRQCKALGSLNPILEYLAECFAIAAENVIQDSKRLVKQSLDRKPEARREKIITLSRQKKEFGIQDVVNVLPEVPLRTLRRDLDSLVTEKKLKVNGANKNRTYSK